MTVRQDYLVHTRSSDAPPDLAAVCQAVYDAVADRVDIAFVDAYSDQHDAMPEDILAAERWLRQRGARQDHKDLDYGRYSRRDPGIGIKVKPSDETGWAIVQAYTPWSIAVELFDADRRSIASFDDCGMFVVVALTDDEAAELGKVLPEGHDIELLLEWHQRRKAERKAARRDGGGLLARLRKR